MSAVAAPGVRRLALGRRSSRCNSSSHARKRSRSIFGSPPRTPRMSPISAISRTESQVLSKWQLRVPAASPCRRFWTVSTTPVACSSAAAERDQPGNKHCGQYWAGAMHSSPRQSAPCSVGWGSSRASLPLKRQRQSARRQTPPPIRDVGGKSVTITRLRYTATCRKESQGGAKAGRGRLPGHHGSSVSRGRDASMRWKRTAVGASRHHDTRAWQQPDATGRHIRPRAPSPAPCAQEPLQVLSRRDRQPFHVGLL